MAVRSRVAAAAAAVLLSVQSAGAINALDTVGANQITRLAGRWAGSASMVPPSGPSRSARRSRRARPP